GVVQVVALEIEAIQNFQRRLGTFDLGDRDGAVQRHDCARRHRQELIIELQDLPPVGGGGDRRVAVDGIDRRLNLVRTRPASRETSSKEGLTFNDTYAGPALA